RLRFVGRGAATPCAVALSTQLQRASHTRGSGRLPQGVYVTRRVDRPVAARTARRRRVHVAAITQQLGPRWRGHDGRQVHTTEHPDRTLTTVRRGQGQLTPCNAVGTFCVIWFCAGGRTFRAGSTQNL